MMYSKISVMGLYNYDKTLFDFLELPAGVERDVFITNLLLETSDMEVLYPNVEVFKTAIGAWSASRIKEWNRMVDAFTATYNPIHNFDRNEDWQDSGEASNRAETLQKVAGYNENAALTDRNSASQNGSGKSSASHKGHLYGNIGVTTTQEMIDAELELRQKDICHLIVKEFKDKFCLLVY